MPIPPPAPAGQSAASTPFNQAGGGQGYMPEGSCAGQAFLHEQNLNVYYTVSTVSVPTGGWPTGCKSLSALVLHVNGVGEDSIIDFVTSASVQNGVSSCSGAFNATQSHILAVSSTTSTTAGVMGTIGNIRTTSGGYTRRRARTGDVEGRDYRWMGQMIYLIEGLPNGWNHDVNMSGDVARGVVQAINAGGLQYWNYDIGGFADGALEISKPWALMRYNLMDI